MINLKTWFITGAARGLGFEITKAVLASGDRVVATVRSDPNELQDKLSNVNLHVIILDVTKSHDATIAAEAAIAKFDKIDVLINNAGFGLLGAIEEGTDEEIRRMFDTNVFGLLNVTRAVLPYMREKRSGHIINISSVGGLSGAAGWGLYASTKFAVEGITEALAKELLPLGIHATAIEPGYFRTNFLDESSLNQTSNSIADYVETVGKMRERASAVNNKQPGDPAKLATAIIKLVNSQKPPVHLPLGKDSLAAYRTKTDAFEEDIRQWHETIIGTDHD